MKRLFLTLMLAGLSACAFSQEKMDAELRSLIDAVCALRDATPESYARVRRSFEADTLWTPMNETGAFRAGECRPSDGVPGFKLNRLLSIVAVNRKYVTTHGDMLNGEDERYNYSLYERSVHAGSTVSYTVKGRTGRQWFALVPHSAGGTPVSASISIEGRSPHPFVPVGNGVLAVHLDTPDLGPGERINITVTGLSDQAFVLLNHNSGSR